MAKLPNPAPVTGKRKRDENAAAVPTTIQIVTGSYEKVLHGFTIDLVHAASREPTELEATFHDTFLFAAHTSAIRCLALSPPSSSKRFLATGSSDERINIYHVRTTAPKVVRDPSTGAAIAVEPSRNKELGSLMHHTAAVTTLSFPTHSKLISASIDNNIGITRSRDWTLLTTIHAPIPKSSGRPSGDTFAPGEVPAGVNDLSVHPSSKLALSVGVGERCMRLWNLVTGKKQGVLTFEKALLAQIGEGRFRGGEGRRIMWRANGEEFVVAFEKGLIVYSLDCTVKCVIYLGLRQRVCQVKYLSQGPSSSTLVGVSTEDGRVILYDTEKIEDITSTDAAGKETVTTSCRMVGTIGEVSRGLGGRIKDFDFYHLTSQPKPDADDQRCLLVTASSDGIIKTWLLDLAALGGSTATTQRSKKVKASENGASATKNSVSKSSVTLGTLIGTYETNRRVTCMTGFVMDPIETASPDDEDEDGSDDDEEDDSDLPEEEEEEGGEEEAEEESENEEEED